MPQILDLEVQAMLAADVKLISGWRYPGRYALYDRPLSRESESEEYMLDPQNGFHAVRGSSGLVGFCSFGIDGRVPGGTDQGSEFAILLRDTSDVTGHENRKRAP